MFDTALVLFVLAGFLIVVAISQPVAAWLKLPQSVVLAAIGIGIGALPAIAAQFGLPGQIDVAANLFAKLPVNSAIFAAVIAVFRDLGAPRRLSWLVEGEALLNDAAAIALFILLLGFIQAGREAKREIVDWSTFNSRATALCGSILVVCALIDNSPSADERWLEQCREGGTAHVHPVFGAIVQPNQVTLRHQEKGLTMRFRLPTSNPPPTM